MNDDQFLIDRVKAMPEYDGTPALFQFHVMSSHILRKKDDETARWQPSERYMFRIDDSVDTGPGGVKIETATNFYDNGVHKTDEIIGGLLSALQSRGYLHDALVVVTSDHGESLGEHGLLGHANSLREEVLRIPLVLISYGYEPQRPIAARPLGSQIDIGPTILSEIGLPIPDTWMGQPLQEPVVPGFAYFEGRRLKGVIDDRSPDAVWKYVFDPKTGAERVFNLTTDPHENRDVLSTISAGQLGEWRVNARSGAPLAFARQDR